MIDQAMAPAAGELRDGPVLVGGMGWPYDPLACAALSATGIDVRALPEPERSALAVGRGALPRGQCAPLLYTTGMLLRAAAGGVTTTESTAKSALLFNTCGPCRFVSFGSSWRRALDEAGHGNVRVRVIDHDAAALSAALGEPGLEGLLASLVVGDALAETLRRLRPWVTDVDRLEELARHAVERLAEQIRNRVAPLTALRNVRDWHGSVKRQRAAPLPRVAIIGEPWSLHGTAGDAGMNLDSVLGRAGVEVEVPPLALWLSYFLWTRRQPQFGEPSRTPDPGEVGLVRTLEASLASLVTEAGQAAGLGGFEVPSVDSLAVLAAPHLPPSIRGGYGHVEVGLAARARAQRRAHAVLSVKSFGCIPSSGISDGIVPTVLGSEVPFLALEVSGDGDAARESRLMLRIAGARERAVAELQAVCRTAGIAPEVAARTYPVDPLAAFPSGPSRWVSRLARAVERGHRSAPCLRQ